MNHREQLKIFSTKAQGVPFRDQGRSPAGWDCWGLVLLAYRQVFGLELPDLAQVSALDAAQVGELFASCSRTWQLLAPGRERPGDVALFRRGRWVCHAGLVVAPGYVLHVEPVLDTCIEPFYRGQLQTRLAGCYRHAKLA